MVALRPVTLPPLAVRLVIVRMVAVRLAIGQLDVLEVLLVPFPMCGEGWGGV